MLYYCLKCKNKTESKNPKESKKTINDRAMLS